MKFSRWLLTLPSCTPDNASRARPITAANYTNTNGQASGMPRCSRPAEASASPPATFPPPTYRTLSKTSPAPAAAAEEDESDVWDEPLVLQAKAVAAPEAAEGAAAARAVAPAAAAVAAAATAATAAATAAAAAATTAATAATAASRDAEYDRRRREAPPAKKARQGAASQAEQQWQAERKRLASVIASVDEEALVRP